MEIIKGRSYYKLSKEKKFFFENYDPETEINKLQTAKSLGVSRRTIIRWCKEFEEKNK